MNKTQCPHCFTVYVISDEQLRVSRGMVRCGTCRERFEAEVLGEKKAPKINVENIFIEPISEQDDETLAQMAELLKNAGAADIKLDDFEDNLTSEMSIEIDDDEETQDSAETTAQTMQEPQLEKQPEPATVSLLESTDPNAPDKIDGATVISWDIPMDKDLPIDEDLEAIDTQPMLPAQSSFNLYADDQYEKSNTEAAEQDEHEFEVADTIDAIEDQQNGEISLIDEVNQLIEQKVIGPAEAAKVIEDVEFINQSIETERTEVNDEYEPETAQPTPALASVAERPLQTLESNGPTAPIDAPFSLDQKRKISFANIVGSIALLLIAGLLSTAMVYQLWQKQMISWPDEARFQNAIAPLKQPVEVGLKRLDIDIADRRNLSMFELVSARTEPHPTRSSTILLRVSLINGAQISQPLPWLELSLTNADGRIVSRRSLSPEDYSYNNRIDTSIGPRELRKVTIELLKFPEQATGYELKLINK